MNGMTGISCSPICQQLKVENSETVRRRRGEGRGRRRFVASKMGRSRIFMFYNTELEWNEFYSQVMQLAF
jgi:hypothetical protein